MKRVKTLDDFEVVVGHRAPSEEDFKAITKALETYRKTGKIPSVPYPGQKKKKKSK